MLNNQLEAENSIDPGPSLLDTRDEPVENDEEAQLQHQVQADMQSQTQDELQNDELQNDITVANNIQHGTPEVIDLERLPAMPSGSLAVVDLTVDAVSSQHVNVVDLTKDLPMTPREAIPVIMVCIVSLSLID